MSRLRLIADDLTGALDSAAEFAPVLGPQRVVWHAQTEGAVLSSATREVPAEVAARRLAALAGFLAPAPGRISFLKVDSLLRGHAGRELAAVLAVQPFDRVIIAPAIPFQRRLTRGGRQVVPAPDGWRATGEDLAATLAATGHTVHSCRPGMAAPEGISLWDTQDDADLAAIVAAAARAGGTILWVGAAALAAALAAAPADRPRPVALPLRPLLGLVGTDHVVMHDQLAIIGPLCIAIGDDPQVAAAAVQTALATVGVAFAVCAWSAPQPREVARQQIACRFAALLDRLDRPGSLFVSGGETLGDVVAALGAQALDVHGAFETGVPVSRLAGGRWDGVPVWSKSGAFGTPDLLSRLIGRVDAAPAFRVAQGSSS